MCEQYMVKYKGDMFWSRLDYIYTDNEKLAKQYGLHPFSEKCPYVFVTEIARGDAEETYRVTRYITYQERRFKVATYGFGTDTYLLLSDDMSLMETMAFQWEDPGLCGKMVPVSETTDPEDEYQRLGRGRYS